MMRVRTGANAAVCTLILLMMNGLVASNQAGSWDDAIQNIERIMQHDSAYQARKSDIEAQQEELTPLKASALPTLAAAVRRQSTSTGDSPQDPKTLLAARAELNLYAFGRDAARWDEHAARTEELALAQEIAHLEAEARAARQLFNWWQANDEMSLNARLHRMRQHLAEVAGHQYERGLLAGQDRQKIELDRDATRLNESAALQKRDQAEAILRLSLNQQSPAKAWPSSNGLSEAGLGWLKSWDDKTQTEVMAKHPRIRAARAEQEAQSARTREARAGLTPTLDFVSEYERVLGADAERSSRTTYGLALNVPILDGLRPSSDYSAQQKKEASASLRLDAMGRDISLELRDSVKKLIQDAEALRERRRFVDKARAIYEANLARFERGLISVNDLSLDEGRLYSFERDRDEGLAQFHRSLLSFCQSAGWELRSCLVRLGHSASGL